MSKKLLLLLFFLLPLTAHAQGVSLGVPCAAMTWYQRQPWALTVYGGDLFVGCGNASNTGAQAHGGPIPIWHRAPTDLTWHSEYVAPEEQVNDFTVVDGVLVFTGFDPLASWELGNWYYLLPGGQFAQRRELPGAIHAFQLLTGDDGWWVAAGVTAGGAVLYSPDAGATWLPVAVPHDGVELPAWSVSHSPHFGRAAFLVQRAYQLFRVAGTLYVDTSLTYVLDQELGWTRARTYTYYALGPVGFEPVATPTGLGDRVVAAVHLGDQDLAISADTYNDEQWRPRGVVSLAPGLVTASPVPVPSCTRPQALQVADAVLYVLCSEPTGDSWHVSVQATCDLSAWAEVATARDQATFGRSLALSLNHAYVGLGTDLDATPAAQAATGTILDLHLTDWSCTHEE